LALVIDVYIVNHQIQVSGS